MDMLFTHDVNYGRQGKGDEANAASSGGLAAAGEPSQIREPGAAPASGTSQFELNSALAGFFSQPIGGSGASASKVPEPAFTAAPAPAYEPAAVPEVVASAAPEPAFVPEPVPEPVFDPAPEPMREPAFAYATVPEPTPEFAFAPTPEPAPEFTQTPEPMPEPALAFAPEPAPQYASEPAFASAPQPAQAAPEPEVTSIPSLDFSFSAQPEPQVDAQPTTQFGQGFTPAAQHQEPFASNFEFSYQPAPAPAPEPAAVPPAAFEPAPTMPEPASAFGAAPQPTAEYATTTLPEPAPEPAPMPAPEPAVAAVSSEPAPTPAPMPAPNLTPQPVFVPEPERSEEPEVVKADAGARRVSKVPVLTSQSVPTKRSINLIEATKRRINKRSVILTTVVAVVILGLIAKFGIFDPYSRLADARSQVSELQSEVAHATLEIESMGDLVDTYARYTYSGMTQDELMRADRAGILNMIERVIMPNATLSSWSVKGDTLTTSITAGSLQDINAVAQLINEQEIVNYCSVVTASNGSASSSNQEGGQVTANIVVYLNPDDKEAVI